jgi:hypothetical protein
MTATVRFALVCALSVALTGTYAWVNVWRVQQPVRDVSLPAIPPGLDVGKVSAVQPIEHSSAPIVTTPEVKPPADNVPPVPQTVLLMRHTGSDRSFGVLAVESPSASGGARQATPLICDRLHFAAGHGVCLISGRPLLSSSSAILFDRAFRAQTTVALAGLPSRVRVSPDGRRVAITVFVGGHSYAAAGFSTATSIIDARTGQSIVNHLEDLRVVRGGQQYKEVDFNFWGVTFAADGNRFYATLATGGRVYLVEGDVDARTVRILREGVECPSLSPDNRRIAFKQPILTSLLRTWRLRVLDVDTLEDIALAETRNVDDQVEWLDDSRIVYELAEEPGATLTNVWVVPADGSGRPEILLAEAGSPTVVRQAAGPLQNEPSLQPR